MALFSVLYAAFFKAPFATPFVASFAALLRYSSYFCGKFKITLLNIAVPQKRRNISTE